MAPEVISHRNTTLLKLVSEVGGNMADLARWPTSQATKTTADNQIKLLRVVFKDSGYPHAIIYWAMLQIASEAYSETINRDGVTAIGLKQAWIKIADLLAKDEVK